MRRGITEAVTRRLPAPNRLRPAAILLLPAYHREVESSGFYNLQAHTRQCTARFPCSARSSRPDEHLSDVDGHEDERGNDGTDGWYGCDVL